MIPDQRDPNSAKTKSWISKNEEALEALERDYLTRNEESSQLIERLEVHQVELREQEKEIRRSVRNLERVSNKYLDFYDFSPVGYVTLNENGDITDLNLTAARLFGQEKYAVKGKPLSRWVSRELKPAFMNYLKQVLASELFENFVFDVEMRFSPDAKPSFLQLHSFSIMELGSEPSIRMAIVDVADKKKTEAADRNNRLLQKEKLIRQNFVSTLVHDLRTPLNSVKLSSQLLASNIVNEEKKQKLITLLIEGVDRADRMIKDLLDFNRLEAGKELPLILRYCHLNQLVENCLTDLRSVQAPHVRLELNASEEIFGFWSHDSLLRMLENLVLNAIKYGDNEMPITVFLDRCADKAFIRVHNFGNPIPLEDQKGLFDAFERTQSADLGSQNGWGLGLSLVASLTARHHGEFSLESCASLGTSFMITLPIDSRIEAETQPTLQ